ncbi:Dynein heavy chain 9, axonemal [Gossypium arboreum]|uniref:Dynein heavy chain 9, axonemal n=1 Tax=Gossypium arboreum TaxID=29729 RepID=A0A0B0P3Y1_GOSAR|nr:Dynein heavy chain 9, axonemal [Gossypium arboreum]
MCSKSFELNEILFRLCVLLSLVMSRTLFRPWIRVRGVTFSGIRAMA